MSSGLMEAVKVSGVLASIIGVGFGASRAIRSDLLDAENRVRQDVRAELGSLEGRILEQHRECAQGIAEMRQECKELRGLIAAPHTFA